MPGEPPGSPGHFLFVTGQKKPRPGAGALGLRDSDETLSLKGNLACAFIATGFYQEARSGRNQTGSACNIHPLTLGVPCVGGSRAISIDLLCDWDSATAEFGEATTSASAEIRLPSTVFMVPVINPAWPQKHWRKRRPSLNSAVPSQAKWPPEQETKLEALQ
jgi:hypothetical protein